MIARLSQQIMIHGDAGTSQQLIRCICAQCNHVVPGNCQASSTPRIWATCELSVLRQARQASITLSDPISLQVDVDRTVTIHPRPSADRCNTARSHDGQGARTKASFSPNSWNN